MKHIATILATASLTACAALPSQAPPQYNQDIATVTAPGYPVESIPMPDGFTFAGGGYGAENREYDSAHNQGSADVDRAYFAWVSSNGQTAVMTALFERLDGSSYFTPQDRSDGYEFIGSIKLIRMIEEGRYQDMAGDPSKIPSGAPDCAQRASLLAQSRTNRERFVGVYTEGMSCDDLGRSTSHDDDRLLERAYKAFGLK